LKEIPEITGMRGYASQAVIVFHLLTINNFLSWLGPSKIALAWNSGVDFFFVLSGFLLSAPFIEASTKLESSSRMKIKEYYLKRVFRIFPVYYLSIFLAIVVFSRPATIQQILSSMLFLQSFRQSTFDSINGVSWTLVIEEIFYATLPLFSLLFLKRRWIYALPICIAISLAYRLVIFGLYNQNPTDLRFFMWQYPSFVGEYAIGAFLANLYVRRKKVMNEEKTGFSAAIPMIFAIALLIATQYYFGTIYSFANDVQVYPSVIFGAEYGLLIYTTIVSPRDLFLRRLFTHRVSIFTGKISYSLYSVHLPIIQFVWQLRLPLLGWISASYSLIFITSALIYIGVERPFLKLRSRFVQHPANNGEQNVGQIATVGKRS
jgi:peptidoglycan/LPS O-acetylase OafA/YrhL